MAAPTLHVELAERGYDIVVTAADLAGVGPFARRRIAGGSALIVTDTGAEPHARAVQTSLNDVGFRTALATRPSGEAQKCLASAAELYDRLIDLPADRR